MTETIKLTIQFLIILQLGSAKDYKKGGADWPEPSCDPDVNFSVSPIEINRSKLSCSNKYIVDHYFSTSETQVVNFSYKGDPKSLRILVEPNFQKLFLKMDNSAIVSYTLKEIIFRVPAEHKFVGHDIDAEGQYFFTADGKNLGPGVMKNVIRSVFYIKAKNSTSALFLNIIAALSNITADTMRLSSKDHPIPVVLHNMGKLNTNKPHPYPYLVYKGTSTDGTCSDSVLWLLQETILDLPTDSLEYYKKYMELLGGISTNARTVVNTNDVAVYICGVKCEHSFKSFAWLFVLYSIVLWLIHNFV